MRTECRHSSGLAAKAFARASCFPSSLRRVNISQVHQTCEMFGLVSLDSSTLGNLARETGRNRHADRITALLNSGAVLAFLSFHHLLELHQHSNPEVRLRRRLFQSSGLTTHFEQKRSNVESLAHTSMWESKSVDPFFDAIVHRYPIDLSRLPKEATMEELGYEIIFFIKMSVLEQRLGLPERAIYSVIRQEMLPSWRIWRGLKRAIQTPKAAGSNM